MTTYSAVLAGFTTGATANAKDYMNTITTLMTNAGFVQSSDTGQITISGITYSSTNGTTYGYQIWYLNDSQHATYPIYIKIMYWMGASSSLGFEWVIGHATDGAGNITGYKYPASGYAAGPNSTVTFQSGASNPSKAVSLSGYGAWYQAPPSTPTIGYGQFFCISREWDDSTGAIKTGGNYAINVSNTYGFQQVCINRANSTAVDWTANTTYPGHAGCFIPGMGTTTASQAAGTTDIFRHFHTYPAYTPSGCMAAYFNSEITAMNTFSTQVLTGGSARTWLATALCRAATNSPSTPHCLAILWE